MKGVGGKYLVDCGVSNMVRSYAIDPENAKKLWDLSIKQSGAKWDL